MRVGIDIGGTFTDLVMVEAGAGIRTRKLLSTPAEPLAALVEGLVAILQDANASSADLEMVVHGTTLVPNALIERKGAVTAMFTTRGFRDVLEIGREWRYDIYDLLLDAPPLLVGRPLRFEIDERIGGDGQERAKLNLTDVDLAVASLPPAVKAIAVCFLNSYANPAHEQRVAQRIAELRPDLYVTASSDLSPEIREYERFSTAVANAYVQPVVKPYLDRLANRLRLAGVPRAPQIVLSNGGLTTVDDAAKYPVRMVESGPSAGVVAAAYLAKTLGEHEVLAFDMGGTTAKASFLTDGELTVTRNFEVARAYRFKPGSGIPLNVTTVELIEIGAGGGSIARVDALGRLKVGPDSAGAAPGPVCYGNGGVEPTVTDADLVLGYLDPARFLGGAMRLDDKAAMRSLNEKIGAPLAMAELQAAWGVHSLINESMANAVRMHAAEHGREVETCTMIPFGGAAGLHACHVAEQLGMRKVISPMRGSVLSAFGMLAAPPAFDTARTVSMRVDALNPDAVQQLCADMLAEGRERMQAAGIAVGSVSKRFCDMQYEGQGHALTIALPRGRLDAKRTAVLHQRFEKLYRRLHTQLPVGVPVAITMLRMRVEGPDPKVRLPEALTSGNGRPEPVDHRQAFFGSVPISIAVYRRVNLSAGDCIDGPAVIEEDDTTVVVPAAWNARIDVHMNLIIERGVAQ